MEGGLSVKKNWLLVLKKISCLFYISQIKWQKSLTKLLRWFGMFARYISRGKDQHRVFLQAGQSFQIHPDSGIIPMLAQYHSDSEYSEYSNIIEISLSAGVMPCWNFLILEMYVCSIKQKFSSHPPQIGELSLDCKRPSNPVNSNFISQNLSTVFLWLSQLYFLEHVNCISLIIWNMHWFHKSHTNWVLTLNCRRLSLIQSTFKKVDRRRKISIMFGWIWVIFTFESQVAAASVLRRAQLSLGLSLASTVVGSQNLQSAYCKPGSKLLPN